MTQPLPAPEGADDTTTGTGANAVSPELQALIDSIQKNPASVAEEMKKLRAEAKQRRLDAETADRDRLKAEAARLEADQKWQEAAQTYKKQLDELTPLAAQLAALKETLAATVQARIDQLPKSARGLVPDYDDPGKTLAWLDRNAAALALPAIPNLNAGEQGDRGKLPDKLPEGLEQTGSKFGVSKERLQRELDRRK